MTLNKKILCLIPARSGSKRLPKKNKLPFHGLPLYKWSILAASKSKNIDLICLSTDDKEIASIAKSSGAEVPFMRPSDLADDHASTRDVILHALEWYKKRKILVPQS